MTRSNASHVIARPAHECRNIETEYPLGRKQKKTLFNELHLLQQKVVSSDRMTFDTQIGGILSDVRPKNRRAFFLLPIALDAARA